MAKHILDVVSYDTYAEIPAIGSEGFIHCIADGKIYCREADGTLHEPANTGGAHPDLATHTGLGLAASHAHPYASDTHNHDASYATTGHTHQAGSPLDAWPVGSIFITVSATSPATLLGGGTWVAFGAGRVVVGLDSGDVDFDTAEETGGAKTITLTANEMPAHTHTQDAHSHVENSNNATTGGLRGWGAPDTSTSTSTATGYSTANATAVNQNTGGGGAHSNVQPYIVARLWKRTA